MLCQKLRRVLQGPEATTPIQGPQGHKNPLGPNLRKVHFNSAKPVAPAEPSDLNCLVARRQLECEAGFPGIHPRMSSGVIPSGMSWSCPTDLNCPAEGILERGTPQLPTWENLNGLEMPLPS